MCMSRACASAVSPSTKFLPRTRWICRTMSAKNGPAATITRRTHLAQLAGFGAVMFGAGASAAQRVWDVPAEGIGKGIRHISYSDMGGKPDGVQIMPNRGHLYIGHQFNDGLTVIDASDPRDLKTVNYFTTGPNTRAPHLQVANDIMLVGNGANPNAMQSYTDARSYFENKFADSITKKLPFRAGLSVHDVKTDPAHPREIAFL